MDDIGSNPSAIGADAPKNSEKHRKGRKSCLN